MHTWSFLRTAVAGRTRCVVSGLRRQGSGTWSTACCLHLRRLRSTSQSSAQRHPARQDDGGSKSSLSPRRAPPAHRWARQHTGNNRRPAELEISLHQRASPGCRDGGIRTHDLDPADRGRCLRSQGLWRRTRGRSIELGSFGDAQSVWSPSGHHVLHVAPSEGLSPLGAHPDAGRSPVNGRGVGHVLHVPDPPSATLATHSSLQYLPSLPMDRYMQSAFSINCSTASRLRLVSRSMTSSGG